jgi:hypothetical protein
MFESTYAMAGVVNELIDISPTYWGGCAGEVVSGTQEIVNRKQYSRPKVRLKRVRVKSIEPPQKTCLIK